MKEEKLSTNEIKRKNRQMIYHHIRTNEPVSKQDIVIALQLSLPTVTQNLEYLKEQKLIDGSNKIKNTGGRNASGYTCVKEAKAAVGVYLTGHHLSVVAVDLSGKVVSVIRERQEFDVKDDGYLRRLGNLVEQVKDRANIADRNLLGVGIAVPGLVSEDGEYVLYGMTFDFTGQTRANIAKYIPYENRLIHDSFAAGYAESREDTSVHNAFYISLSNSVGGTAIMDNEVYVGDNNKGGEIGHMNVVPTGGQQCYCGKQGCLDTVCRAGNLDRYTEGNLEEFFRRVKAGDAKAKELWEKYLDDLSLAIHNIRMLYDGTVILGGYVGEYIGDYMEDLYWRVDERNPFGDKAKDYLVQCRCRTEATAAGAAMFYTERFIEAI